MLEKIKNETVSQILIRSASLILAIIAYILLSKLPMIMGALKSLLKLLFPFLMGFLFAFVLVKPQRYLEKHAFVNTKFSKKTKRNLSVTIVFVVFVLAIVGFVSITLSGLIQSLTTFASMIPTYSNTLYEYIVLLSKRFHFSTNLIDGLYSQYDIGKIISNAISSYIPKVTTYSVEFFSGAFRFLLALVSAVYMLLERESLLRTAKKLNYTIFNKTVANRLVRWIQEAKLIFEQYIVGSVLDALIIGVITTISMAIIRMPYTPMIGLIIGVTNIIPIFGPFLGAIPVILILLVISPFKALIFAIFILVLQQVDGNVIKPVILGSRLGISGFWVLFSVSIGGSIAGVPGMFLGVPIFALIYAAVRDYSKDVMDRKKINLDDTY